MRRHPDRRGRVALGAAISLPVLALLAVAGLAADHVIGQSADRPPATLVGPVAERTYTTAPGGEVREVHRALHGLGDRCAQPESTRSQPAVGRHVAVMLDFARRHPDAQFEIDDENGTSLSLLLVLQDELRECAPALLPGVLDLLPPDLRRPSG
jgi:hypothetical protein